MRNDESHFSSNPVNLDIGRSRFPRPFNHKFTMDVGDLVPFYWSEVLPGDTVQMNTSKVVRLSTLLDPVMDNLFLDTYYFFVPMRLTWDHTREFFGENTTGPWYPSTEYTIPQMSVSTATQNLTGSVLDYMGVPVQNLQGTTLTVNALPVRAYNICYRDWFMSEALETPPNIYTGDATISADNQFPYTGGHVYVANKLHDYFTSCLPGPQRARLTVAVPGTGSLVGHLDVKGLDTMHTLARGAAFSGSSEGSADGHYMQVQSASPGTGSFFGNLSLQSTASQPGTQTKLLYTNLVAMQPSNHDDGYFTTSINVNELRMAFQMQKWYEKSAMYGGRYIELLKAQFGVTSPDGRLQRSEYLGGNRVPISIHQVENNSATGDVPLGHLGAYSATSDVSNDFIHSFTEHGFLIGICCVRYKHTYAQGLERAWSRKTMWDYYWPVLANIGNQAVLKKEIYCEGTALDTNVFGYQEAWADYRYQPDRVSALMRPGIDGSLASWHFADNYESRPSLSEAWLGEDASNVDRTLAVKSTAAPQLICDFLCDSVWIRAMPLYSIPGLVDHH